MKGLKENDFCLLLSCPEKFYMYDASSAVCHNIPDNHIFAGSHPQ